MNLDIQRERYNLQSQLERLKSSQILHRRERIRKSQSVGNNLEQSGNILQHRRLTSVDLYTTRQRLSEGVNCYSTSKNVKYSSSARNNNEEKDIDVKRDDDNDIVGEMRLCGKDDPPVVVPEEEDNSLEDEDRVISSYARQLRRLTEPDLHHTITSFMGMRGRAGKVKRPASAHGLPNLPASPYLIQHNTHKINYNADSTTDVTPDTEGAYTIAEDEEECITSSTMQTVVPISHCKMNKVSPRRFPTTRAYFKSPKRIGTQDCGDDAAGNNRRCSLDPQMIPYKYPVQKIEDEGDQGDHVDQGDQGDQPEDDILTPTSYFRKYGIPLEKSQLRKILHQEREILQRRIKAFLIKNNP